MALALALLAIPSEARANDATLRATLATWSQEIAVDAHSLQLSAVRRHPRRLAYSARRFASDALQARRALAAQRPSSTRGKRAQRLALAAFGAYASAGREWASSGQARLQKQRPAARRYAKLAAGYASKGNGLLLAAARLIA